MGVFYYIPSTMCVFLGPKNMLDLSVSVPYEMISYVFCFAYMYMLQYESLKFANVSKKYANQFSDFSSLQMNKS